MFQCSLIVPGFSPLNAGRCSNMHVTRHHNSIRLPVPFGLERAGAWRAVSALGLAGSMVAKLRLRRPGRVKPNYRLFVLTVEDDAEL